MSVGGGFKGDAVKITGFGGSTIAGIVSKSLAYSIAGLDTTDDTTGGNAEYHSEAGRIDRTMSISGKTRNLDMIASLEQNLGTGQNIYAITISWPDGSTMAGDVFITSFNQDNPHEELATFEMEIAFSGRPTFTAGV